MCENTYVNVQTGEELDMEYIERLKDNAMLQHKPELWCEWDFKKNNELGLNIYKVTKGSEKKVWWNCPKCESSYDMNPYQRVKLKCKCPYCRGLRVNSSNSLMSLNPELASEWHPAKNGDLTPNNVTINSGIRVWWLGKCGHEWDTLVSDRTKEKGTNCPYCNNNNPKVLKGFNDLWTVNKKLSSLLLNPEDGYKYTEGSSKKVDWKCDCGEIIKNKIINDTVRRGLACPKCSDGISFGEKVMYHLLSENNIDFEYDRVREFSDKKRYDFYVPKFNLIIEIQGEHHSQQTTGYFGKNGKLEDEIRNDNHKKEIAFKNGIKHYFTIDVINRDIDGMKNNIIESGLLTILDVKSVNWIELSLNAQRSLVLDICKYYRENEVTTTDLSAIFKLTSATIIKYLKLGDTLNICDYSPNSQRTKTISKKKVAKPVVQFDLEGNFIKKHDSIKDAVETLKIESNGSISACCKGQSVSAHGYIWRYYEDVKDTTKIKHYRRKDNKSIVQLSLDGEFIKLFNTVTEASNSVGGANISKCCNGTYSQSKGYRWMYKDDYEEKYGKIVAK